MKAREMKIQQNNPAIVLKRFLNRQPATELLTPLQFEKFLSPIQKHLYNFIFKSLNFSEDAEDILQNTVIRAFKYRKSYKHEQSEFKNWIFTIAANEIRQYFKKKKSETNHIQLEENISAEKQDSNILKIFEAAADLSPTQRIVFFLFYDQEFSINEAAEITGLKKGNIKTILSHARSKIREVIK